MAESLCQQEKLEQNQVKLQKSLVRRGQEPVGLLVRVEGPRLMRAHALWIEQEHRILFYDSAGKRHCMVTLAESPELTGRVID